MVLPFSIFGSGKTRGAQRTQLFACSWSGRLNHLIKLISEVAQYLDINFILFIMFYLWGVFYCVDLELELLPLSWGAVVELCGSGWAGWVVHSRLGGCDPYYFVLFHSCCSREQVFGRILVHEFHISCRHTYSLFFSDSWTTGAPVVFWAIN